jgi:hypothetical protein
VKDRSRPWRLITTDDPDKTFGQARQTRYPTLLAAANARLNATDPYTAIIYDDGDEARELTDQEERFVEAVAAKLGYDIEHIDGAD